MGFTLKNGAKLFGRLTKKNGAKGRFVDMQILKTIDMKEGGLQMNVLQVCPLLSFLYYVSFLFFTSIVPLLSVLRVEDEE
jgi:hypothetical protein